MVNKVLVLFLIFGLFFSSCQESKSQEEEGPEIQVFATLYSYEWLGLYQRTKDKDRIIVIDLRTIEEYNNGKVEDAVHLYFNDPEFENKIDEFDREKTYLLYSTTGGESTKAMDIMYLKDFIEVYDLRGGVIALEEIGYELSQDYDE